MIRKNKNTIEIANSGSMADIAFLLLIFFMLTTTIINDKGLDLTLPPPQTEQSQFIVNERNLFKILVNSDDELFIEGKPWANTDGLREEIKSFILNPNGRLDLSENPEKAVVSIKTNRGTSQEAFIKVLDEAKAAYFQIYGDRVDMDADEFRSLSTQDPIYKKARLGIPMNISIAEPSKKQK